MKVLVVVAVCAVALVNGKVTPDFFPSCKRSDPKIDVCILTGVERLRPHLKGGIPELNIPPIEPFVVPTLKLDRTAPNLRLKAVIRNMKAYGGSDFVIEKLKINLKNKYAAEIKLFLPKLQVAGDYDVRGSRLLVLDINGKGKLRSNFTGITVVAKGAAKAVMKDGVEYLHAEKVITKLRIANGQVAFDDTERPVAAASAASFFNVSPGTVLDILNPLIEETGAAVLKAFLNKIFASIPLKDILLED